MRPAIAGHGDRLRPVHTGSAVASRSGNRARASRAAQRIALDFAALERIMSAKELSTLQANVEAKPGSESTIAAGMDKGGTPHIPEEVSILPVPGTAVFPRTIIPLNTQRAASLQPLGDTLTRTNVLRLVTQPDE